MTATAGAGASASASAVTLDVITELSNTLLTADNKGWRHVLCVDNMKEELLCAACKNLCKDAIELSCDDSYGHSDNDIQLYCHACLQTLIAGNGNRCPLSNHENASMASSRISRKRILNLVMHCPNSVAFQHKQSHHNENENENENENDADAEGGGSDNNAVEDTLGMGPGSSEVAGCHFSGKLSELLQHIGGCVRQQSARGGHVGSQLVIAAQSKKITVLQTDNQALSSKLQTLNDHSQQRAQEMDALMQEMSEMRIRLKVSEESKNLMNMQLNDERVRFRQEIVKLEQMADRNRTNNNNAQPTRKAVDVSTIYSMSAKQITLEVKSFRKCYVLESTNTETFAISEGYHPRNLFASTDDYYASAKPSEFSAGVRDWLIFQPTNRRFLYVPTQLRVRNWTASNQGVRQCQLAIGSSVKDEWTYLSTRNTAMNMIEVQKIRDTQTIEFNRLDETEIGKIMEAEYNEYKIELIDNQGGYHGNGAKFVLVEFHLYGIRLPSK